MTTIRALVHVVGLGAELSPNEGRVDLRTALRPYMRSFTHPGSSTDAILGGCEIMLGQHPAAPPVTAVMTPHGPTRSLLLAYRAHPAVDAVIRAQAFANDFRGRPDSPAALRHMHLMSERMLGKTTGVDEAKRVARACILRLHPDRCRGLLRIEGRHIRHGRDQGIVDLVDLARRTLLQGYIELLQAIEEPSIGPYITGPVAFTTRQALGVIKLAAEQRLGRSGAHAAVCGALIATAGLSGVAWTQILARGWLLYVLIYAGAALAGWHSAKLQRRFQPPAA